jgi:hypothetical protein
MQRQNIHLQNELAAEQQKRAAIEKEYRRLKAEFQKLKDAAKHPSRRWTNPLGRTRTRAPKQSILEDIEEEGESVVNVDGPSDHGSSSWAPLKSLPSRKCSGRESLQWGSSEPDVNCLQCFHLVTLAVTVVLLCLFWLLILLLGWRPVPNLEFTLRPALIPESLLGEQFSISAAMNVPGLFSYVVLPAQHRQGLEERKALIASHVVNLVGSSKASELSQVWIGAVLIFILHAEDASFAKQPVFESVKNC